MDFCPDEGLRRPCTDLNLNILDDEPTVDKCSAVAHEPFSTSLLQRGCHLEEKENVECDTMVDDTLQIQVIDDLRQEKPDVRKGRKIFVKEFVEAWAQSVAAALEASRDGKEHKGPGWTGFFERIRLEPDIPEDVYAECSSETWSTIVNVGVEYRRRRRRSLFL